MMQQEKSTIDSLNTGDLCVALAYMQGIHQERFISVTPGTIFIYLRKCYVYENFTRVIALVGDAVIMLYMSNDNQLEWEHVL